MEFCSGDEKMPFSAGLTILRMNIGMKEDFLYSEDRVTEEEVHTVIKCKNSWNELRNEKSKCKKS